jgi:hypothetical protein
MQITRKVVVVVAAGALVAAGSGAALARSSSPEAAERPAPPGKRWHHRGPIVGILGEAAEYLGLERTELRERLRNGSSLADVARAEGKSVDGLKATLREAFIAELDARLDTLVEREFRPRR